MSPRRFLGYGWQVLRVSDANDRERIADAIADARRTDDRPTLIIVESHIGYGAPHKQDTSAAHGEPLGRGRGAADQARLWLARGRANSWCPTACTSISPPISAPAAKKLRAEWLALFERYRSRLSRTRRRRASGCSGAICPRAGTRTFRSFPADPKGIASRDSSAQVLNAIAPRLPWLLGGAADLAPSTKTRLTFAGAGDFEADEFGGRNFHFGIREHAMGSICNGMSVSKLRPYGSGFLIFSDYMKAPIRLERADGVAGRFHLHP